MENAYGKSSPCNLLKNLSQIKDFDCNTQFLVEIEIRINSSCQSYKYENMWTPNKLDTKSVLFFVIDFITANVHTHCVKSNNLQQFAHIKKTDKLIIDLDEQSDKLKSLIE